MISYSKMPLKNKINIWDFMNFMKNYRLFIFINWNPFLFQQASRSLNLKDGEVKDSQFRIVSLQEDVNRLKKLVETSQVRHHTAAAGMN